jgi:uncharacterized protein (DUF2147 family)
MKVLFTITIVLVCLLTLGSFTPKADNPDAIVGTWLSSKKRNQVQIFKQGSTYYGRVVWMMEANEPGTNKPKMDEKNPEEKLRNRPLINLVILTNMNYKGGNLWSDGQIYNPEDGRTYGCDLAMRGPNILSVHGYMLGMRMLGQTKDWTRVK